MELSKYQEDIKVAYKTTSMNLVINACPGSGKTFTLLMLAKNTSPMKSSIFLAFNKSIQEELSRKLPTHVKARTLHSLGMSILLKYHSCNLKVTDGKTFKLCRDKLDLSRFNTLKKQNSYMMELCQLVDIVRMNLITDYSSLTEVAGEYDILATPEHCLDVEKCMDILNTYNRKLKDGSMIDFCDMLYLCKDLPPLAFPKYDVVFVDECQDLNPMQKFLVDKIRKSTGRFIAVGDKKQAIYSFMGSNLKSFEEFEKSENTLCLPLSRTYRCSKSVTECANGVFPDSMEYLGDAPEGEVREGKISEIEEGDIVICRNNKPLVQLFLTLVVQGKKSHIYGKDYGEKLLKMIEPIEGMSYFQVKDHFDRQREQMLSDLKDSGISRPQLHPKVVNFDEMVEIIFILLDHFVTFSECYKTIKELFSDEVGGITLMTCHKSKGLEARRVFFYQKELIPSPYATSQQMLYAEKCLYYVAVTRAKESLIYIQ